MVISFSPLQNFAALFEKKKKNTKNKEKFLRAGEDKINA